MAALSIDIVRTADGVKGDESTYVAMALSAAFDGDLAFERRDLQRFWTIYNGGPEGIFLKAGRTIQIDVGGGFPFVHATYGPDPRVDRYYYGKAAAYSVAAAPFVRLAGINGLLFFNVLLLVGAFLAALSLSRRAHVRRCRARRPPLVFSRRRSRRCTSCG